MHDGQRLRETSKTTSRQPAAQQQLIATTQVGAHVRAVVFDALQLRLQQMGDALLPYQLYLMLPYVLSIVALVLVARKASYPQALMKPYRKGER